MTDPIGAPGAELEFARTAVEGSAFALILTNPRLPDNPIVLANDAFCTLTGYSRDELLGRNCRMLQGPDTHPDSVERLRRAVKARESVAVTLLNYRKDGSSFLNSIQITPIFGPGGEAVFFVGTQIEVPRLESLVPMAPGWTFQQGK